MNLRDGVTAVRNRFGEGRATLITTPEIIQDLNTSAQSMMSAAQFLTATYAGQLVAGQQEYPLPLDVDAVIQVKVQYGLLMPVVWAEAWNLQIGAYVTSLPLAAYLKRASILTTMALPGGSGYGSTETIQPPPDTSGQSRWVIGFYPLPASAYNWFCDYYQLHPPLVNPMDPVSLPPQVKFFDAWVAYAIAKACEKAGDDARAANFMAQHNDGTEAFVQFALISKAALSPPMYGGVGANPLFARSPSVLVVPPQSPQIDYS